MRLAESGRQSILGWCSTRCMQYSVYAVLGEFCTQCYLLIMAWRDSEGWLNFVFLGDGRVEDDKESDESRWEIIMRNWDLRESHVQVIFPFLVWPVRVPIRRVITPILGLQNPIRHVVPLISHICSYTAYCSHFILHRSFLFTTLPSSQEHKVESSLSIDPCHDQELTLSKPYTEYSIHSRLFVYP